MEKQYKSLITPATRKENNAAWTIKQWAKYIVACRKHFYLDNPVACDAAFDNLVQWVLYAGEEKFVTTAEAAALYLIETHGIGDGHSLAEAFARKNWEELINAGYKIPAIYKHKDETVRSETSAEVFIPKPRSCNQKPAKKETTVVVPITQKVKPEQTSIEFPELSDECDDKDPRYKVVGVKHPNQTTRNCNKKYNHNITEFSPITGKILTKNDVIIYDVNGVNPIMVFTVDVAHAGFTSTDELRADGYYNAIRYAYYKKYEGQSLLDIRIISATRYKNKRYNRIRRIYEIGSRK